MEGATQCYLLEVRNVFFSLQHLVYRMLRELLASRPARDPVEGVG
jgi:hypothetical protein